MKAVVHDRFGPPDIVELREIPTPQPGGGEVLVRVRAASLNRIDWYTLTGTPWIASGLRRRRQRRLGLDFAGTVEAVGEKVADLQPGDDVFGGASGALAEYVSAGENIARKPANVTFEEAAAVRLGALTALQGLRDHGHVQPGQHVLVNGASGGVGTFAVQIAKALGAEVTAVCSTRNVDTARALGADHVFDYTRQDFTRAARRYDVIFDIAGSKSWRACKRVLTPEATLVIVGGPMRNRLVGPLGHMARVKVAATRGSRNAVFFIAKPSKDDLDVVREWLETGKVKPVVERTYGLDETADALRYLGEGHARGKIVVTIN